MDCVCVRVCVCAQNCRRGLFQALRQFGQAREEKERGAAGSLSEMKGVGVGAAQRGQTRGRMRIKRSELQS